jgi:hypothetical protein
MLVILKRKLVLNFAGNVKDYESIGCENEDGIYNICK